MCAAAADGLSAYSRVQGDGESEGLVSESVFFDPDDTWTRDNQEDGQNAQTPKEKVTQPVIMSRKYAL
jgi:hypothetical protein